MKKSSKFLYILCVFATMHSSSHAMDKIVGELAKSVLPKAIGPIGIAGLLLYELYKNNNEHNQRMRMISNQRDTRVVEKEIVYVCTNTQPTQERYREITEKKLNEKKQKELEAKEKALDEREKAMNNTLTKEGLSKLPVSDGFKDHDLSASSSNGSEYSNLTDVDQAGGKEVYLANKNNVIDGILKSDVTKESKLVQIENIFSRMKHTLRKNGYNDIELHLQNVTDANRESEREELTKLIKAEVDKIIVQMRDAVNKKIYCTQP